MLKKVCPVQQEVSLQNMESLELRGSGGRLYRGGSQAWYRSYWHRMAGCGPTNGANLIWHLARTRPALASLYDTSDATTKNFLGLMELMFQYITPTIRGVNTTRIFRDGALGYARQLGAELRADVLDIPPMLGDRPAQDAVRDFLCNAFAAERPVAFLNLSNGSVRNLDAWHWVTLVALEPGTMTATMLDQGRTARIDLAAWLRTTTLGGGFVTLDAAFL